MSRVLPTLERGCLMFSFSMIPLSQVAGAAENTHALLSLNPELQPHGLILTEADVGALSIARVQTLKSLGRIELDLTVTQEIARRLSASAYITQDTLVQTIADLYEIFHYIKNATSDHIPDVELLDALLLNYENFDGSTELMLGKGIERIVENYRQHASLSDFSMSDAEWKEMVDYWNFAE